MCTCEEWGTHQTSTTKNKTLPLCDNQNEGAFRFRNKTIPSSDHREIKIKYNTTESETRMSYSNTAKQRYSSSIHKISDNVNPPGVGSLGSRIRPRSSSNILTTTGHDASVIEAEEEHYLLQEGVRFLIGLKSFLLDAAPPTKKTISSTNPVMVTIPAAAMEWLDSVLHEDNDTATCTIRSSTSYMEHLKSLKKQLLIDLKPLIHTVTHLQIIGNPWPNSSAHNDRNSSPRINVQIFPSVQVLILDKVIPEWLVLEQSTASQLTLFKMQRGCIYDVYSLFNRTTFNYFPRLTHLRLSECAIGELSGLVFEQQLLLPPQCTTTATTIAATPPIFSQMPNLKSINLRKNQIIRVETAVAGLKSLLQLEKIDLSYNYIKR